MQRLPGLTGLRGIAAAAVVLFHALILLSRSGQRWDDALSQAAFTYGWTGVDLFFVVSGFLLALPFVSPGTRHRTHWPTYATKRITRIAPPYYAIIALTALLLPHHPSFQVSLVEALRHIFYVHNAFPTSVLALNAVFWTLAIEMQFYLVLPLVAPLFAGRRWPWALAGAALVTFAWRAWFFFPDDGLRTFWATAQVPAFALHFALGITAARLHTHGFRLPRPDLAAAAALVLFVGGTLHFVGMSAYFGAGERLASILLRPLIAVGFVVLVLAAADPQSATARLLSARPLHALGAASYSLYLVHWPLIAGLGAAFPALLAAPVVAFYAGALAVCVCAAALFYHAVERPSLVVKELAARRVAERARRDAPGAPAADGQAVNAS